MEITQSHQQATRGLGPSEEIAADELAHVKFLRKALGAAAVARPSIDIDAALTSAALAVTAYRGAAPLITNKTHPEAVA